MKNIVTALLVLLTGCSTLPEYKGEQEGILAFAVTSTREDPNIPSYPVDIDVFIENAQGEELKPIRIRFRSGTTVQFSKALMPGDYEITSYYVDFGNVSNRRKTFVKAVSIESGQITFFPYPITMIRSPLSSGWIDDVSIQNWKPWQQLIGEQKHFATWRIDR